MSDNLIRRHVRVNVRTGLPRKAETSETILQTLYCLFPCTHESLQL